MSWAGGDDEVGNIWVFFLDLVERLVSRPDDRHICALEAKELVYVPRAGMTC